MSYSRHLIAGLLGLILLGQFPVAAAETVAQVLARENAPPGIVFEIVSSNKARLGEVLPGVRKDMEQLRKKFPGLDIVVVSHGDEQFALSNDADRHQATRNLVQSLVTSDKVTFHVCGTYAQMKGVDESAFPDYVDVAPHGPAQIRTYVDFGYIKILVK